ncbi:SRPBCC family protein [Halofilum ochraceum]|uniref:SRPBCC family protein n=1 Tax=Halofilum ochraceum TaxID=1611323 RepID=UPI00082A7202|nr:SRPBCC family protein [Halofilum ochraceum]
MVQAQVSREIERPLTTVFEFVAVEFFDNYPRWSPEVRELEPLDGNAVQAGMRARQVRMDRGRRSETVFRVTKMEPYRRVRFEGVDRPAFVIEYVFEPLGPARCRLDFTFELQRLEMYMRPFERLIRKAVHEGSENAVTNIKQLIERER